MKYIAVFSNFDVDVSALEDAYCSIEIINYTTVFDLWNKAYDFFIERECHWEFLMVMDGVDIPTLGNESIGLLPFSLLYKEVIPYIYDRASLYDAYGQTFFAKPINTGQMVYLNCSDLIGIVLEVKYELSKLSMYGTDVEGRIINSIAMGRVNSLQILSRTVQKYEESRFPVVCLSRQSRV